MARPGARDAVERAAKAGFDHLSLDLIYGVPVGGEHRWEQRHGHRLRPAGRPPQLLHPDGRTQDPVRPPIGLRHPLPSPGRPGPRRICPTVRGDEGGGIRTLRGLQLRPARGRSRHNSAYWNGTPYLGIGPGAHSFLDGRRWWNARSNAPSSKPRQPEIGPGSTGGRKPWTC